jgi:hypothetical protein
MSADLAVELVCVERWTNSAAPLPVFDASHPDLQQADAMVRIDEAQSLRSVTQIRRNPIVSFVEARLLNSADQWVVYDGILGGQPHWASAETGTARWPDGKITSHPRVRLECKVRVDGVGPCDIVLFLN